MTDLQTIIRISQEALKKQLAPSQALHTALQHLNPREQDVVRRRHALDGKPAQTLQEIGAEFGITRERVRQLEKQGTTKLTDAIGKPPLADMAGLAAGLLRESGGLISQPLLLRVLLPESQRHASGQAAVVLLLALHPDIHFYKEDRNFAAHYTISEAHHKALVGVTGVLSGVLKTAKQPLSASALRQAALDDPQTEGLHYLLTDAFIASVLETATAFVLTEDERWGLSSWSDINPRNIREKTQYMLKHAGEPLHFNEITNRIRDAKFDAKRVTTQAVHNELINGDEFVLIGRGIYALGEWGYVPGTVADVIRSILKDAATTLDREDIVTRVLQQRQVSRNTILINLQEKGLFTQVEKHQYRLTE